MAILTLVFGREVLGTHDIKKEKTIIGRADDCDIVIDNLAVSRHHTIIERKEGVFTINDLDSNNGTFVNGQRIVEPTPLNFGDEIGIGKHVLVFDSHSRKIKPEKAAMGEAQRDMDSPDRGTLYIEPESLEKIQKKSTTARKAHLRLVSSSDPQDLIAIEKSDTVFGRARDCDVKIQGLFASQRHAILSRLENGFHLTNLAVFSRTRVNGVKIESTFLCDGDEITMGKSKFTFHSEK
jgi:pSer/pThr/pTyr-binding forkhead associated (FHA) protein